MSAPNIERFDVRNRWINRVQFTADIICAPDATIGIKLGLAVRWAYRSGAVLRDAVLRGADLRGAVLRGAVLRGADLRDADLSGAVLRDADLRDAVLRDADLSDAVLRGAVLRDADLRGADLRGADLRGADLSGAVLRDADLRGDTLRAYKADFFLTLSSLYSGPLDAQHLIAKLCAGEVDGSTYGRFGTTCACLVGTIAQAQHVSGDALDHGSSRPAEQWYMMIKPGDKPGALGDDGRETGGGFAARIALEWALDWCRCHGVDPDGVAQAKQVAA